MDSCPWDSEAVKIHLYQLTKGIAYGSRLQKFGMQYEIAYHFPISIAGHKLNLQKGGKVMVWFGITWFLELYQQCVCRCQEQLKRTEAISHMITKRMAAEKIMKVLSTKDSIIELG